MIRATLAVTLAALVSPAQQDSRPATGSRPARSPHHAHLARFLGEWDVSGKTRATPDAELVESESQESDAWICDGAWLLTQSRAGHGDRLWLGLGITGYDTEQRRYVSAWVDSSEKSLLRFVGECERDGRVITMRREDDPRRRVISELGDGPDYVGRSFDVKGAKEFESGQSRYHRVREKALTDARCDDEVQPRPELAPLIGSFDARIEVTPAPGALPIRSTGQLESRLVCNRSWVESRFTGRLLDKQLSGYALLGYDLPLGKWVGVWVDSLAPGMSFHVGTHDRATRTFSQEGGARGFDGVVKRQRVTTRVLDDGRIVYAVTILGEDGVDWKSLEATYTRRN